MKKFFLMAVSALVLSSCNNSTTVSQDSNVADTVMVDSTVVADTVMVDSTVVDSVSE